MSKESPPDRSRYVGRALDAPAKSPSDPQWHLRYSNHPLAPFVGNALRWDSFVFDDGTTYEGLTRESVPHGKGVLVLGNGTGGGIENPVRGDRYEGEFYSGFAHGIGQYTSQTGEVYRGEWALGKKNGCGVVVNMDPFLKQAKGAKSKEAVKKAWKAAKEEVEANAKYGTWTMDFFVSPPSDDSRFCHINEIKGVLQELDSVVMRARMFQYKPDGEVTIRMAQDANGTPLPLMQDPIHYPHDTKFMAPGPMGQVFPVPDDEELKAEMRKHARNYARIYNMYNFDYNTVPGSDQAKAEALWQAKKKKEAARRAELDALERRRLRQLGGKGKGAAGASAPGPSEPAPGAPPPAEAPPAEEGGDFNDEDLVASVSGADGGAGGRFRGLPPPTVFGSVSLGMGRAVGVLAMALDHCSRRALPRRSLSRPSRQ